MRRKAARPISDEAHTARVAWLAAFLITLALLVCLSIVRSAQASTSVLGPTASTSAVLDEEPGEEEEGEEESSEECKLEAESQAEAEECDVDETGPGMPADCRLSSAEAAVTLNTAQAKLRLAVRYTAPSPGAVGVDLWLRGGRGPLNLDGDLKRNGRTGVIHLTQALDPTQLTKVLAARSFVVELRPIGAPRSCHAYLDQHLTVKRGGGSGPTWMGRGLTSPPSRRS